MTDELIDKILPEIRDWDTLYILLKNYVPSRGPEIAVILRKADSLTLELDLNDLSNSPLAEIVRIFSGISLETLFTFCHDSFLGNLIWLSCLFEYTQILDSSNINYLRYVLGLEHIDTIVFIKPEFGKKLLVRLGEDITENTNKKVLVRALRTLFQLGVLELDRELVESFKVLLKNSEDPNDKRTLVLIEALEKCEPERLVREYRSLTSRTAEKIGDINFKLFYEKLLEIGCPVFFNQGNIRYNGVIYNGNFFPIVYLDLRGNLKIIKPFKEVPIKDVQKLQDPLRDVWFIPRERYGKIALDDIFSFRDVKKIPREKVKDNEELISKILDLSENNIEDKIRKIIGELGSTPHTSTEIGDLYLFKMKINNEDDLRNVIVIIKKGPKKAKKQIVLREISHQIIKAVQERGVELIILIHIAPISDEVRSALIDLCNLANKMYCVIDVVELARLFVAYNVI